MRIVKRYDFFAYLDDDVADLDCHESEDGGWVGASDYAALEAERDQLRAQVEAMRKQIDDMSPLNGAPMTGPDLKCIACGGYHYGMSGLPCPNMAATANAALQAAK